MPRQVLDLFLSSTFEDLRPHRRVVSEVITRLGQFSIGMETFGADPKTPLEACRQRVRRSDALVVVVGHRYGWIPPASRKGDGKRSITWWEVAWALEAKKPVYAFLIDEKAAWTGLREQDRLNFAKTEAECIEIWKAVSSLRSFREFLNAEVTSTTFSSQDHLGTLVVSSLFAWLLESAVPTHDAGGGRGRFQGIPRQPKGEPKPTRALQSGQSYWHEQIHLRSAWELTPKRGPVRVALIAGRPITAHPALAGVTITHVGSSTRHGDAGDDYTTALAAVIASHEESGFIGVAPGSEILNIDVLQTDYTTSDAAIADAIDRAVVGKARIICLTLGGGVAQAPVKVAIRRATDAGVLVVCAAGNESSSKPYYPAAFKESLAVGGVDAFDAPAYFTSYGDWVHVAAPGVDLPVPAGEAGYAASSGTSWACAIVAGVAALLLQADLSLSPEELRHLLSSTARARSSDGHAGTVNAWRALQAVLQPKKATAPARTRRARKSRALAE